MITTAAAYYKVFMFLLPQLQSAGWGTVSHTVVIHYSGPRRDMQIIHELMKGFFLFFLINEGFLESRTRRVERGKEGGGVSIGKRDSNGEGRGRRRRGDV